MITFILAEAWTASETISVIGAIVGGIVTIITAVAALIKSNATALSLSRMSNRLTQTQDNVTKIALQTPPKQGTTDEANPTDRF